MNIFQIIKFLIEQTIVIAPPILITSVGEIGRAHV